jgi:hypothetical protein
MNTKLKRILCIIAVALTFLIAVIFYLGPVALSFYAAKKAVPVTRVVPTELKDHTLSRAPGMRVSYLGYDFEVPWNDLDDSKTQLFPKNKPAKTMAVLVFRSGLKIFVTSHRPREVSDMWEADFKTPEPNIEVIFGPGSSKSDYIFMKGVWTFTPDTMHHWSLTPAVYARESVLLVAKSFMSSKPARSGIFNVRTRDYVGFQQGDLGIDREGALVSLFADDGGIEFLFDAEHYNDPSGITQPEINRIVQTLRKAAPTEIASSAK